MPDANKFKKLREIGYTIPITCKFCVHGHFKNPTLPWGTCKKHQYKHLKHTGPPRGVSIHAVGTCQDAESKVLERIGGLLGAHAEFLSSEKKG
jgi:hypothetical protein